MASKPTKSQTAPAEGAAPEPSGGVVAKAIDWILGRGGVDVSTAPGQRQRETVALRAPHSQHWAEFDSDPVSLSFLSGTEDRGIRGRQQIYATWQNMSFNPIIYAGLRLHVTAALGGHESRGEMIFIEATPEAKKVPRLVKLVEEIAKDLQPKLNECAPTLCLGGVTFGDAYARLYGKDGVGLTDIYTGEMVYGPLIQPWERGSTTVGYSTAVGNMAGDRLSVLQMTRLKMPRLLYLPQTRVTERAMQQSLTIDDIDELTPVAGLVGGSFLDGAEEACDRFIQSWNGLTGQRIQDSIDERIVTVNQTDMTNEMRGSFRKSLTNMVARSNAVIRGLVAKGGYYAGKIVHFIPVVNEKQLVQLSSDSAATGKSGPLSTEDVMMNGRFLAGALGLDLSLLGFADLLSGGFGDGGFFRVSAQTAERSRMIRAALTPCLNHIIEVHLYYKHGLSFAGQDLPWTISYFSGISSLETEKAKTKADRTNAFAVTLQAMESLKQLGFDAKAIEHMLTVELGLDAKDAKLYAAGLFKAAEEAKKLQQQQSDPGFGGGGGGGGEDDGGPPEIADPDGDGQAEPVEG